MIIDRPMTDLELQCVCEAQFELRKEDAYKNIIKEIEEDENYLRGSEELTRIRRNEYAKGFWDGQRYQEILEKKLRQGHKNE